MNIFLSHFTITFRVRPGDITRRNFGRAHNDISFFVEFVLLPVFLLLVPTNSILLFSGVFADVPLFREQIFSL